MIHAACSNSNHLRTRQKPDADKGWRNQCRLGTAILLIPSAFQSEHLGIRRGGSCSFWGFSVSRGCQVKSCGPRLCAREHRAPGAMMSDLPPGSPVHQAHLEGQYCSPALWLRILCSFYSERLGPECLAQPLN